MYTPRHHMIVAVVTLSKVIFLHRGPSGDGFLQQSFPLWGKLIGLGTVVWRGSVKLISLGRTILENNYNY